MLRLGLIALISLASAFQAQASSILVLEDSGIDENVSILSLEAEPGGPAPEGRSVRTLQAATPAITHEQPKKYRYVAPPLIIRGGQAGGSFVAQQRAVAPAPQSEDMGARGESTSQKRKEEKDMAGPQSNSPPPPHMLDVPQ